MSGKNVFVFVVCGADEHIATLNFSLKQLKRFSQNSILVVTDTSRNHIAIKYDNIIDVPTPIAYDHHQASIYLKTGLHKFLDLTNNYCYLDSDVIALSPRVDEIFQHQYGPVTFAPDQCKLNFFSSAAVNCPCSSIFQERKEKFASILNATIPDFDFEKDFENSNTKAIAKKIKSALDSPFLNFIFLIKLYLRRFLPNSLSPKISENIFHSVRKKAWVDLSGNIIAHDIMDYYLSIKKTSQFRYNRLNSKWYKKGEGDVFDSKGCLHLVEMIKQKFGIVITDKNWQHWNGGVFLFNKNSFEFLETWHQHTLDIFTDKQWKTRDQGTLAATVWQMGLQDQKTLPLDFNFIVDYYNQNNTYKDGVGFTRDNFKTILNPHFIHVYHEFGNKNWDIWKAIEKTLL